PAPQSEPKLFEVPDARFPKRMAGRALSPRASAGAAVLARGRRTSVPGACARAVSAPAQSLFFGVVVSEDESLTAPIGRTATETRARSPSSGCQLGRLNRVVGAGIEPAT